MQHHNAVAVVGVSGVFPKADNSEILWNNIINRLYSGREIPAERWIVKPDSVFNPEYTPDKTISKKACLITEFKFDSTGINLNPELLKSLDPLYHLVLHAGRELLSDMESFNKERTGVILAAIALPTDAASLITRKILGKSFEEKLFGDIPTNKIDSISAYEAFNAGVTSLPGAIMAEAFGLGAGTMTIDAACASSIYAVKLACDKLNAHQADMMIAGGVSRPESLYTQIGFSQLKALSGSGICAPFDESADGLVVGEGVGLLALKRLDQAQADNDKIYGIIRGTGLSNDIRGNLLAPDIEGQVRSMKAAYEAAGWTPFDVDLIECHGAGTPVGDHTELLSLRELWGASGWSMGQCAIGSVKSNIGHLLTGAGAAGMIKILLALKNEIIPPSCNFKQAAPQSPLSNSSFRVPTEPEEWRRRAENIPRRAAVSAFGFGGINGHILFEEWRPNYSNHSAYSVQAARPVKISAVKKNPKPEIAIIGMDVSFGSLKSLREFQETIFKGDSVITKKPADRWQGCEKTAEKLLGRKMPSGAFAEDLSLLIGEFRIPPKEIPDILIQQLLMLKVAAGAIKNAGISIKNENPRAGAIIGIGFDFETTDFTVRWNLANAVSEWQKKSGLETNNVRAWLTELEQAAGPPLTAARTLGSLGSIVASRIAREFRFGGPSFSVSCEETSGLKAIRIGVESLQNYETDLVLAGAVDLCGDVRSIITYSKNRKLSTDKEIYPFDENAAGTLPGEGAAAIIMKRLDQAQADGDRIYSIVKSIGTASGGGIDSDSPSQAACIASMGRAFKNADLAPSSISLFEAHGSGDPNEDRIEAEAAAKFFAECNPRQCALGSIKPNIGHTGAVSGLASVVKASLCLFQEIIPPLKNFKTPACQSIATSAWHIPVKPLFWLRNMAEGPRRACVGAMTGDGNVAHLILESYDNNTDSDYLSKIAIEQKRPLGFEDYGLFMIEGENQEELLNSLARLSDFLKNLSLRQKPIGSAANKWYLQNGHHPHKKLGLSITARDISELEIFINDAEKTVRTDRLSRIGIQGGVAYSPEPFGSKLETGAKTAFVFPGSGNHYLGMGRELSVRWPEILRSMDHKTGHLKTQLIPEWFMPLRSSWPLNWKEEATQEIESNVLNMIFGQVVHGGVVSNLVRSFGVEPDAVIGYSLGESAGFFALKAWPDRAEMLKKMQNTQLFTTELAGPCLAARKAWNIPGKRDLDWHVAVVNRPAGSVRDVIKNLPETRLLIINTPDQCVIGGIRKNVTKAINRLGCESVDLKGIVTVHCDAAEPVAEAYRTLHLFPVNPNNKIKFYSCALGRINRLTTESAADSILNQALHGFDFNKTINQAYADGVRIFLEMGPHSSCTGMISSILGEKPHLAVSACSRYEDDHRTIIKLLGSLAAERVAFNPDMFYGQSSYPQVPLKIKKSGREIKLLTGKKAPQPHLPKNKIQSRKNNISTESAENKAIAFSPFENLADSMVKTVNATARAHQIFLEFADFNTKAYAEAFTLQNRLLEKIISTGEMQSFAIEPPAREIAFSRQMCLEFATGSIAAVLGPEFAEVDSYKARVRLPDEPLMLVDRIISIQGQKGSLGQGRIVTEHDVLPGAWYLDGGRAPVCISVEAGQADLFLCSYMGIDLKVKGTRTYRLLDATVKFHSSLPVAGDLLRYDIEIEKFIRQGETYIFFFNFKGTANGRHLITMTNGCAGFFTEDEVKNSGGIILTDEDLKPAASSAKPKPLLWEALAPAAPETYDDAAIEELRKGNPFECFGNFFEKKEISDSLRLPGEMMTLLNRVLSLDPNGGRFGLGLIRAEADIHPKDWFLTCHFVDDMVMPGTLMYECCAHTLRIFVQRMGWIHNKNNACYEPVTGIESVLKCRGPVTPKTEHVIYEIEIKEAGYNPEPYVIADAYMYADGQMIVLFTNMSLRMSGTTESDLEEFWKTEKIIEPLKAKTELFSKQKLLAFATGRPSDAFGEKYLPFDSQRFIARLPAPPFLLIDRITRIEPEQWRLQANGGWIEAEYDIPETAWYFKANRSTVLPFSILLEIALQPCGWLAAYLGSALKSKHDLKFRNLDGNAILHRNLYCYSGTLTVRTKLRQVSEAGGMLIEQFDFQLLQAGETVYEGDTTFGFFTEKALLMQTGLSDVKTKIFQPDPTDLAENQNILLADAEPLIPDTCDNFKMNFPESLSMPAKALKMIDKIDIYLPDGGPDGLGFIRGSKQVNPDEWYFKAHFLNDPVIPGSLGIESFLQLLKFMALQRWHHLANTHRFELITATRQTWSYRGQILPKNHFIEVEAVITNIDEASEPAIYADGFLKIDGLYIYKISGLGIRLAAIQ